jgi:hypothetical protein
MKTSLNIFMVLIIALLIGVASCGSQQEDTIKDILRDSKNTTEAKIKAINDYIGTIETKEKVKYLENSFHSKHYIDPNGHTITVIYSSGLSSLQGVYHDPECAKCKLNKSK